MTEKTIRDAKPRPKAFILWDQQVKGLGAKVFPGGEKSFVLSYRVNGKKRLATLARCSELTLKGARERAGAELVRIRDGEVDPLARRQAMKDAPTMVDLWEKFESEFVPDRIDAGRMARRTFMEYRKQFYRHIAPVLGDMRVSAMTRAEVERMARHLRHIPQQRNRVLALLSRLMTLAETWEWRGQHTNPVKGVTRAKETVRDRILAPSEMQRLNGALLALEDKHPFEVKAIFIAALTGLRISECLSLRWENIDLETGRAILPTTKTGRRVIPLAGPVKDLLADVPRLNGTDYVFPSLYTRRGVTATTYKTARRVFAKACEQARLQDVRLHDLRRSLATSLAGAGINAFTLRDVLGHRTLDMSNRYVRMASEALTEASELAATIAATAMKGTADKGVVPIKRKQRHAS